MSDKKRPLFVFQIPDNLLEEADGIKSVGIIELRPREEMMASRRAQNDGARLAFELAREALRRVNDRAVSTGDGSTDTVFDNLHPKIRTLIVTAYSSVNTPKDEQVATFLQSRQVVLE